MGKKQGPPEPLSGSALREAQEKSWSACRSTGRSAYGEEEEDGQAAGASEEQRSQSRSQEAGVQEDQWHKGELRHGAQGIGRPEEDCEEGTAGARLGRRDAR